MLIAIAFAALALRSPEQPARAATARVRIERPVVVRAGEWERIAPDFRREVVRVDESGRPVLLRIVEMP